MHKRDSVCQRTRSILKTLRASVTVQFERIFFLYSKAFDFCCSTLLNSYHICFVFYLVDY